jgi:hypothetical protein
MARNVATVCHAFAVIALIAAFTGPPLEVTDSHRKATYPPESRRRTGHIAGQPAR